MGIVYARNKLQIIDEQTGQAGGEGVDVDGAGGGSTVRTQAFAALVGRKRANTARSFLDC